MEAKARRDSNIRNPDSEDSCYEGSKRELLGELDANCNLSNSPSNAKDIRNSVPANAPMAEDCISKDQPLSNVSEVDPSNELYSERSFSEVAEPHCLKYEDVSSHLVVEDKETEGHSQASVVASSSHPIDRESCINDIDQSALDDESSNEDDKTLYVHYTTQKTQKLSPLGNPLMSFHLNQILTPLEIAAAIGNSDCLLVEHPLVLKSSSTKVEDTSGTRDASGEPLVTSYNMRFMGTVDYIWHSEGLHTVGVFAPLPKDALNWTSGFPTKKWGSDHIALVAEFSLTRGAANQRF